MAVRQRAEDFVPEPPPPGSFTNGDGQFDSRLTTRITQNPRCDEEPVHECQGLFDRQQMIIGCRQDVRQNAAQSVNPISPTHPTPECGAARVGTQALVDKADRDGFTRSFKLKFPSHLLVNRACARRLLVFHSPTINSQSVASFQLHRSGLERLTK